MNNQPVWMDAKRPEFSTLAKSTRYDVVIVGGGITGMTAAWLLKESGKKVCLLEKGQIGGGETGHTSAHLAAVTDERITKLAETFGEEQAGLVWIAGAAAIDFIERTVDELKIDCEFRRIPGILHSRIDADGDESDSLMKDAELANKLGFVAEFGELLPGIRRPGVCFADQARFQPVAYVAALAKAIQGNGCDIFEKTEVTTVEDSPLTIVANDCRIECDDLVIATHVPLMGKTGLLHATLMQTKLYPYSTYVIGATVPHGTWPDALFWDTSDPYYYLRLEPGEENDLVIFGGEDHKTGQGSPTEEHFSRLEQTLQQIIPGAHVERRWSGQVIETNDGLPYIGEAAEHQFVATGFAGNGLTFGTLAGMMACDRILGRNNPWQKLFALDRTKLWGGSWNYLVENLDYPYYFIKDWLTRGKRQSTRTVKRGQGQVLTREGKRVACAHDENGKLSQISAVCTHMGCLVRWNDAEQTWDCPCHGSRFATSGEVIGGPAEKPLPEISENVSVRQKRTPTAS